MKSDFNEQNDPETESRQLSKGEKKAWMSKNTVLAGARTNAEVALGDEEEQRENKVCHHGRHQRRHQHHKGAMILGAHAVVEPR